MKNIITVLLIIFSSQLIYSEEMNIQVRSGLFIPDSNCVESGFALMTKDVGLICLGFHSDDVTEKDLKVGMEYSFWGYMSEDGYFVIEILDCAN